jgi:hypothetical protein
MVWSRMVRHLGNLCDVAVQPIPFTIQWDFVRDRIIEGLVLTGYSRYVDWFGSLRYMKRFREENEQTSSGPLAFKKQRRT